MFTLEIPAANDAASINHLLDVCFGADRQQKTSYKFRDGVSDLPGLRRVAYQSDRLVGTIAYWPVRIGDAETILLGPVAVCPKLRGNKIGQTLIWQTLIQAKKADYQRVVLVGDASYYRQFGFVQATEFGVTMNGEPDRLMALAMIPGGFDGVDGQVTGVAP